jgi:hypothetical protein
MLRLIPRSCHVALAVAASCTSVIASTSPNIAQACKDSIENQSKALHIYTPKLHDSGSKYVLHYSSVQTALAARACSCIAAAYLKRPTFVALFKAQR